MARQVAPLVGVCLLLALASRAASQTTDTTEITTSAKDDTTVAASTAIWQSTSPGSTSGKTVRLVGGSAWYEGNVEVLHRGVWGSVCSDGWDINDATVVCRMLGLLKGAVIPTYYGAFILNPGTVHLSRLACQGSEDDIQDCPHSGWGLQRCSYWSNAGVVCMQTEYPPWEVRLVGGVDDSEGRLEVFDGDSWGTVCDEQFDYGDARVVCRMLGFVNDSDSYYYYSSLYVMPGAYFGEGTGEVKLTRLQCSGREPNITHCRQETPSSYSCPHSQDVGVICQHTFRPVDVQVRIGNGNNATEGLVEVFHNGRWGPVCDNGWDVEAARVVCRQLGLPSGSKVETRSYYQMDGGSTQGKPHLSYVQCNGSEGNLGHCTRYYPLGVTYCSSYYSAAGVACIAGENHPWEVRLVGGADRLEGRLEVFDGDSWATVCNNNFDSSDARVVCRMLMESSDSWGWRMHVVPTWYFGEGSGDVKLTDFRCSGREGNLTYCMQGMPSNNTCPHSQDVGVICNYTWRPTHLPVRLAQSVSSNATAGPVEVFVSGQWLPVDYNSYLGSEDVVVACRQLGLPHGSKSKVTAHSYRDVYPHGTGAVLQIGQLDCRGNESDVGHCHRPNLWYLNTYTWSTVVGVTCLEGDNPGREVRLVGGSHGLEGRVEVFDGDSWGTICGDRFDSGDARVVCKMLMNVSDEYYYSNWILHSGYYGSGSGPMKLEDLQCARNEFNITFCPQEPASTSNSSCLSSRAAAVNCKYVMQAVDVEVRLAGNSSSEGLVEVLHNGQWGTISYEGWDAVNALVVCRQLGFDGDIVETRSYFHDSSNPDSKPVHLNYLQCNGSEENIGHCSHYYPWGAQTSSLYDAGVACTKETPSWKVRLHGGGSAGRVEVSSNDTWGTVCDESFGDNDAKVICSMLGFYSGSHYAVPGAYYGEGGGPVLLTKLGCKGVEGDITYCVQESPGTECPHSRDAGVVCGYSWRSEEMQVRLVGETENEGRVEVLHNGQWGTVCSHGWDVEDARVVCRQLGLPSGYRVQAKTFGQAGTGSTDQRIHLTDLECNGTEANLGHCRRALPWGVHYCGHADDAGVACLEGGINECVNNTCDKGFYPYGNAQNDLRLEKRDDVTSPTIHLKVGFPVGRDMSTAVYVGSNGIISFDWAFNPNYPYLYFWGTHKIIAPFWSDININASVEADVFYHVYDVNAADNDTATASVLQRASSDVARFMKRADFQATWVLVATWHAVPPYAAFHGNWWWWAWYYKGYGSVDFQTSERATFQCVLISDGEESFALFHYQPGSLSWRYLYGRHIIIGSVGPDNEFQSTIHSERSTAYNIDQYVGNTGEQGVWAFRVGKAVNPAQACWTWYRRNRQDDLVQLSLDKLPPCPCAPARLAWDRRWGGETTDGLRRCLRLRLLFNVLPLGKECCYINGIFESTVPYAGSVLRYHPFFDWRRHQTEDVQAKRDCCDLSPLCHLYYQLRPASQCAVLNSFQEAALFGDPYIMTLDGRGYSFNGWGEYVMLEVRGDNQSLTLQGRTSLAQTENGTASNATVFSAFAARDSQNASLQVELNANKTGMIIYGNGIDHTTAFESQNFEWESQTLTLLRENNSLVASFAESGLSLKVSVGVHLLTLTVTAPTSLKTRTRGLLGTFNDNPGDDFLARNGTTLPDSASDHQIFRDFGETWRTTAAESVFQYPTRKSHADFQHPDFLPIFLDQVDPALLNTSYQVCGGRENLACVFDYVATGSRQIAAQSATSSRETQAAKTELAKEFPTLGADKTAVRVNLGATTTLQLQGSDPDLGTLTYHVISSSPHVTVSSSGVVTYSPRVVQAEALSFYVRDSDGLTSQALTVDVVICTLCSGHGTCNYDDATTVNVSVPSYRVASCTCALGWTGADCESDVDACASNPCSQGQNCSDLDPAAHQAQRAASPGLPDSQLGFRCSACPPGFSQQDNKCQDVDECNSTNTCDQVCVNSQGSYSCSCYAGFRRVAGRCQDIDECAERTSGCQQICTNTQGNFSCSCEQGFRLQSDSKTCTLTDAGRCSALGCQYGCRTNSSGALQCFCAQGFQLASDSKSCQNVDECQQSPSPCQQRCQDLSPGFQCSCLPGFSLDSDKVSCTPCGDNRWGQDCSQTCECGGRGRGCHAVSGCQCQAGWTGRDCGTDVDECQASPCGADQLCLNTQGSFLCRCPQGYTAQGTQCIDVDECGDPALNTCSQDQTCHNSQGAFYCTCPAGFQNPNCTDIDECATGQSGCQHICYNVRGSFNCRCKWGYELGADRKSCVKVEDVCAWYGGKNCSQGCTVEEGSTTPTCFCDAGYQLQSDGLTCLDKDECSSGDHSCSHNCTNTAGNYQCSCLPGFYLDSDKRTCKECNEGFWGDNCAQDCGCGWGASRCDRVAGCVCQGGWRGSTCREDLDECVSSPCLAPASCINTPGSFRCVCPAGLALNSTSGVCEDVDECEETPCQHFCNNTLGSFHCSCLSGFTANGTQCQDVDECASDNGGCQHQCSNNAGAFLCGCDQGYDLNPDGKTCREVDECAEARHDCSPLQTCSNSVGSFSCACLPGYVSSGASCSDVDECGEGDPCSEGQTCVNSPGSFSCSCTASFTAVGSQCIKSKGYDVSVSLDLPFAGDNQENRQKFRGPLKSHFERHSDGNSSVIDVNIKRLRAGSTVVEMEVVMNAAAESSANTWVVRAVLRLRDSGLTVDNQTLTVLTLQLQGQTVTSSASACDVMGQQFCQGPGQTCVATGTYTAECRDASATASPPARDDLILGLAIGVSLATLVIVAVVIVVVVLCMKKAPRVDAVEANLFHKRHAEAAF